MSPVIYAPHVPHECDLPYTTQYRSVGVIFQCADCGQHWLLRDSYQPREDRNTPYRAWYRIGPRKAARIIKHGKRQ